MGAEPADLVLTKGDAARALNVSPGRISQYLSSGRIHGPAIEGEGRNAKINVTVARIQLRARLDIGQRLGNGINTRLNDDAPADELAGPEGEAAPAVRYRPQGDPVEEAIKSERLRSIQFTNREKAEAELARRGTYTRAADVRAAMSTLAAGMMNVFEGGLADIATAISARFEIPQRDVLHLLRTEFVNVRRKAAETAKRQSADLPGLVTDDIVTDDEQVT